MENDFSPHMPYTLGYSPTSKSTHSLFLTSKGQRTYQSDLRDPLNEYNKPFQKGNKNGSDISSGVLGANLPVAKNGHCILYSGRMFYKSTLSSLQNLMRKNYFMKYNLHLEQCKSNQSVQAKQGFDLKIGRRIKLLLTKL